MAALGDILSIAHVLKRAHALYEGCRSAPEEIYMARDHIHAMTLCLEGVDSDLVQNPKSFVHQNTDIAKTRRHALKVHVGTCERALNRTKKLLEKYLGFMKKHVKHWDRFRWSIEGKKEIAECKADLVLATSLLDLFLSKESLNVLWKLESTVEALVRQLAAFDLVDIPAGKSGKRRSRASSNAGRTVIAMYAVTKLKKKLKAYREKKEGGKKGKMSPSKCKKSKGIIRTNSGFVHNPKRSHLVSSYAVNVANSAKSTPLPPYTPGKGRPRTPSPDFYYIPGGTSTPTPGPIRRSSSMGRLTTRLNAKIRMATPQQREHYECWRVGIGKLAIGTKTAPQFLPHKRGQTQLKKMAAVFKEAAAFDARAFSEKDSRAKAILDAKNKKEKKERTGKKWYFVAARVVGRDPGKTGMVSVEKAVVILVRR